MNLLERMSVTAGALIVDADSRTFRDIAEAGLGISQCLRGGERILLWSDDVQEIITTLVAGNLVSADVFVAHRTISPDEISNLVSRLGITHLATSCTLQPQENGSNAGRGFIYVMTSGTTRTPKVARHTPESVFGTIQKTTTSEDSRWLLTYPPTSFAGLQVIFSAALGGGSLVAVRERSLAAYMEAALSHGVTHVSGTPTFWRGFMLLLGRVRPPLRQITLGGEVVDQSTIEELRANFPSARITQIYASTEAGVAFSVHDGKAGLPAEWLHTPPDGVRLRVVDQCLQVQSARALRQYELDEPTPFEGDGWLATGDLVRRESDRLLFTGRIDRRINIGGFKVSPEEVESVLMGCPGIADVQISSVPSPISTAVMVAKVVPKRDADRTELKRNLRLFANRNLEPFKVPRLIEIVESICAADSGKKSRI